MLLAKQIEICKGRRKDMKYDDKTPVSTLAELRAMTMTKIMVNIEC